MPKADRLCWKFSVFSFLPFQCHLHSTLPKATIVLFAVSSSEIWGEEAVGQNKEESFNFYEFNDSYFYTLLMNNPTKGSGKPVQVQTQTLQRVWRPQCFPSLILQITYGHVHVSSRTLGMLRRRKCKGKQRHCDKRVLAVTGAARDQEMKCTWALWCLKSDRSRPPPLSQAEPLYLQKRQRILSRV